MTLQLSLYVLGLALATLLSLSVALVALKHRDRRGSLSLGLAMLAVAEWSVAYILEASASTIPEKVLWSKIAYIGTLACGPLALHFAAALTHRDALLKPFWIRVLVWSVPPVVFAFAFTNELHGLVWNSFTFYDVENHILAYGHGPVFWVMVLHVYSVLTVAAVLLIRSAYEDRHTHRRQSLILLLSLLPPSLISVIYTFLPHLLHYQDWIPVGFSITGLLLWWGLREQHLLDFLPIARCRVFDEVEDGVIVLDHLGRIVDVNPAATRLMEVPDMLGRDAGEVCAQWTSAMRDPVQSDSGTSIEPSTGEIAIPGSRLLEWRIAPIGDRASKPAGNLIILTDITLRREAERALQNLNTTLEAQVTERTAEVMAQVKRTEAILQSVSDGVMMTDHRFQIHYVNPAFAAITGFSTADTIAHSADSILGADLQAALRPNTSTEASQQTEGLVPGADGRIVEVALTRSPMRTADGCITGYVFTLHDVGQSRALDRARKGFLDNISHQLRTPVATLRLYTLLLRRAGLPAENQRSLDAIEAQVDWLQYLIQDILEMASLDSNSAAAVWDRVEADVILQTIVGRYEPQIHAAGLQFRGPELAASLPPLRGDLARLVEAVSKVVDNAIRFTPKGGEVSLTAAEAWDSDRPWVIVAVQNTGKPIPVGEHSRIFERFQRGSDAEIGQLPGTGIGLSITEAIIHAHGGHIVLRSEEGTNCFELWIPAAQEAQKS